MSTCSDIQMSQTRRKGSARAAEEPCEAAHLGERGTAARKQGLMSDRAVNSVAETFSVLGDPSRVRILDALSEGDLCVCDIAAVVGISESAVSHQLRLLRGMRLVRPRRAGRQVYYALDDHHIIELLRQAVKHVEEQPSAVSFPISAEAASRAAGGNRR